MAEIRQCATLEVTAVPEPHRAAAGDVDDFLSTLYLTMVRLPRCTLAALRHEGYAREEIVRSAEILTRRGLVAPVGPEEWQVLPPDAALLRYAAELELRARYTRNHAEEIGALWRRVHERPDLEGQPVGVELLTGIGDIVSTVHSLKSAAQRAVRSFWGDSVVGRRIMLEPFEYARADRPAEPSVSCVVDTELLRVPGVLAEVERRAQAGQRIRVTTRLPFSGLVCDDQAGVVDLSAHDPTGDGSLLIRRPAGVAALAAFFHVVFEHATPLAPALAATGPGGDGVPLDARDRRILALLAAGATDQAIARQLGSSTRTVERRVRHLMELLGAVTRFQAGVRAGRRGWL